MATGTEKLDAAINEARRQLDIALRDASNMRHVQNLRQHLHHLEEEKRAIDRSVFGSFATYGEMVVKNPSKHTILKGTPVTAEGKALSMEDLSDAVRYATRKMSQSVEREYDQLQTEMEGRAFPRFDASKHVDPGTAIFLSPDGKPLGKIENIEAKPPTVFLQELEKIK